jgi:hypothetical protein
MCIGIKLTLCNNGVRTCRPEHTAITLHINKSKKDVQ